MSPTISTFHCPSSTFQNPYFTVHHMIPTTHIHISFQLQPEESPSTHCIPATNPAPTPSTFHTLPSTCLLSPSTIHLPSNTTIFHHPHQPLSTTHRPPWTYCIPPSPFYHWPATTITHGPFLPSPLHRAPLLLTTHFPLFDFPASFILFAYPSFSSLCDHQILLINNISWICISF